MTLENYFYGYYAAESLSFPHLKCFLIATFRLSLHVSLVDLMRDYTSHSRRAARAAPLRSRLLRKAHSCINAQVSGGVSELFAASALLAPSAGILMLDVLWRYNSKRKLTKTEGSQFRLKACKF